MYRYVCSVYSTIVSTHYLVGCCYSLCRSFSRHFLDCLSTGFHHQRTSPSMRFSRVSDKSWHLRPASELAVVIQQLTQTTTAGRGSLPLHPLPQSLLTTGWLTKDWQHQRELEVRVHATMSQNVPSLKLRGRYDLP